MNNKIEKISLFWTFLLGILSWCIIISGIILAKGLLK